MKKTAILYRSHSQSNADILAIAKLKREVPEADIFHLFGPSTEPTPDNTGTECWEITDQKLMTLGYCYEPRPSSDLANRNKPPMSAIMRHCDYPIFYFFKQRPQYEHYWMLDYDVRFTGNWGEFFQVFSQESDFGLLGTYIADPTEDPYWAHWFNVDTPLEKRLRCYFPLVRFTHDALTFLDKAYLGGKTGFVELIGSSLLNEAGMKVGDFWGNPKYRPNYVKKIYYQKDTFFWRPCLSTAGPIPDTLYHPVK